MTRDRAIAAAEAYFDEGGFAADLARRVAIPSESQVPERASMLACYLDGEIAPSLQRWARPDPCGGCPAMGIPTAILHPLLPISA